LWSYNCIRKIEVTAYYKKQMWHCKNKLFITVEIENRKVNLGQLQGRETGSGGYSQRHTMHTTLRVDMSTSSEEVAKTSFLWHSLHNRTCGRATSGYNFR